MIREACPSVTQTDGLCCWFVWWSSSSSQKLCAMDPSVDVVCCSETVTVAWLNQSSSPVAWVTRPERPEGVKDVIKQAQRAATLKSGPGGPLDFYVKYFSEFRCIISSSSITSLLLKSEYFNIFTFA